MVCMVVLLAALVLCSSKPGVWLTLIFGLVLGFACLVRPTVLVFCPFFVGAWIFGRCTGVGRRLVSVIVVVFGMGLVLTPWLAFNFKRGIPRLSGGSGFILWYGLAQFNLLDPDYPLEDEVRKAYESSISGSPRVAPGPLYDFVRKVDGRGRGSDMLGKWARASIRKNFRQYLKTALYALGWQLDYYHPAGPYDYSQFDWYLERRGRDGSGFSYTDQPAVNLDGFAMSGKGGPLRRFFIWWSQTHPRGVPQVPLFVGALLATLLAVLRRDGCTGLVFAGTIAFIAAHAVLLSTPPRYALPVTALWYTTPAILLATILRWAGYASPSDRNA